MLTPQTLQNLKHNPKTLKLLVQNLNSTFIILTNALYSEFGSDFNVLLSDIEFIEKSYEIYPLAKIKIFLSSLDQHPQLFQTEIVCPVLNVYLVEQVDKVIEDLKNQITNHGK